MLQIIYGRAGVGKSYNVIKMIKNDAENKIPSVLLVPEQFTFESEKAVLHELGAVNSRFVTVLSFTRLYDEVSRFTGGTMSDVISSSEKFLFMCEALKNAEPELTLWKNYTASPKFAKSVLDTVDELRLSLITSEILKKTSDDLPEGILKSKLKELSIVFSSYNALLGNKFTDPVDKMTDLNEMLLRYDYFAGKNVYIDSFKAFSGQQYKIIERILLTALNTFFAITCDTLDSGEINLFKNTRDTANRIIRSARMNGIEVSPHIRLTETHYNCEELLKAENLLANKDVTVYEKTTENVVFCEAKSPVDEAVFTARTIRKLVRTEKYRYKDFVVIARNSETYDPFISDECRKNRVFCFTDKRSQLTETPLFTLIDAAFDCVKRFSTESLLKFHKTGFGTLDTEQISQLENYAYVWKIDGEKWLNDWNMNPDGFSVTKPDNRENDEELLKKINTLRTEAVKPILYLRKHFNGTSRQRAEAVFNMLKISGVPDKMRDFLSEYDSVLTDYEKDSLRQSWDYVVSILDSIVKCSDSERDPGDDFIEYFRLSASLATIGNIPQGLDEVTFGSADRIRPSRPKVVFILGANQGVFPALPVNTSLIGNAERKILTEMGLDLKDKTVSTSIDESMLVYSSVTCAVDKLFITYSISTGGKGKTEKSAFVDRLEKTFVNALKIKEPSGVLSEENLPETAETATSVLCENYADRNVDYFTLSEALKTQNEAKLKAERIIKSVTDDKTYLSPDNAKVLFGDDIYMSATRFDRFHTCAFGYFCKYGLNTAKLRQAELDHLQRGTMVHYVLEHFVNAHLDDIRTVTDEEAEREADELLEKYLSEIGGSDFVRDNRFEYMMSFISENVKYVVKRVVSEFRYSDFDPKYCELSIGYDKVIPTLKLPFSEKGCINFTGSIDRLDIWQGYVRIVDYKTGSKDFKMPEILYGLNMQMLLYLYSVVRGKNNELNKYLPAGILYMSAKKERDGKEVKNNGVILADTLVANAMNAGNDGRFLPEYTSKSDKHISSEMFEEIFDYIELLLKNMGNRLHGGEIPINPRDGVGSDDKSDACKYCDYRSVCLNDAEHTKIKKLSNDEVEEQIKAGGIYG